MLRTGSAVPHKRKHNATMPCKCADCSTNFEFALPVHLIESLKSQDLVLFAGAGVSTEDPRVFPYTFAQDIAHEMKVPAKEKLDFAELMSRFCALPDGRIRLLRKILARINYVHSHPELYFTATEFHRELSTLWQIKDIITTNWDDFFERECGAIPLVSSEDLAFWEYPSRRVLKLHGSIDQPSSIVATVEDYAACYDRLTRGLLGSTLKTILATRTVLFVGFSLKDSDLRQIFEFVRQELKKLQRTHYFVNPHKDTLQRAEEIGLVPIQTSGSYCLRKIKEHLAKAECNVPDGRFALIKRLLPNVRKCHFRMLKARPIAKFPESIHCAAYQDGLMHAFDRILARAKTGEYSHVCKVQNTVKAYSRMRREKLARRAYHDVSYIDGYMNGLIVFGIGKPAAPSLPLFYVFGAKQQPRSLVSYCRLASKAGALHSAAHRHACKISAEVGGSLEFDYHHTPFLL